MKQERFNKRKAFRFKCFAGKTYSAFNSLHREVTIGVVTSCVLTFAAAGTVSAQTNVIAGVESAESAYEPDEVTGMTSKMEISMGLSACPVMVVMPKEMTQSSVQCTQKHLLYNFFLDLFDSPTTSSLKNVLSSSGQILFNGFHVFLTPPVQLLDIGIGFFKRFCRAPYPTDRFFSSICRNRMNRSGVLAY